MDVVTVTDPTFEGTKTTYLVTRHRRPPQVDDPTTTTTTATAAPPPPPEPEPLSSVRHRHSEFQWLYERLHKERRGAVVPLYGLRFGVGGPPRLAKKAAAAGMSAGGGGPGGDGPADDAASSGSSGTTAAEDKCRRLERFMRDVTSNPELRGAPSLEAFLSAGTGQDFDAARGKVEATCGGTGEEEETLDAEGGGDEEAAAKESSPAKSTSKTKGRVLRQYVAKTVTKTATSLAARGGQTKLHETDDEAEVRNAERYVKELEATVKSMAEQASGLVRSGGEGAGRWTEIGRAASSWSEALEGRRRHDVAADAATTLMSDGKSGGDESVSVTVTDDSDPKGATTPTATTTSGSSFSSLGEIGALSDEVAAKMAAGVKREAAFTENLTELTQIVAAVKVALHKRSNSQLICTSRFQHRSKVSAQEAGGGAAPEDVAKAEGAAREAEEELERATGRLLREVDRIDVELNRRLAQAVGEFGQMQLEKAEAMRETWSKMAGMASSDVNRKDEYYHGSAESAATSASTSPEPSAPPLEDVDD